MSLYNELKRRNVIRVAVAYLTACWLLIQVADTVFPVYGLGTNSLNTLITVLAIGFPLFLLFSWIFELTPEGIKREVEADHTTSIKHNSGKRLDRIIIVLLALALGYFAFDKFVLDPARDAELVKETTQKARADALTESYGDSSIAVLPFVNMSSDPEQEYFSDGISEEILNLLAKIPELRVISRSSAFSYKGKEVNLSDVAKELNVAHILEGSVRRAGSQVRITAQLIEARSDTHLWSETYDRNVLDVFAIQDEIAGKICTQLELTIVNTRSPERPTDNEDAYDLYLRGLHFLNQVSIKQNPLKARDRFQAAIELDPDFAQAYALLSMALTTLGNLRVMSPMEVFPEAQEAAMTALKLDESLYLAHVALGWVALSYERDWSKSEIEFRYAIELAPSAYEGHLGLAWALQVTGRYDEAFESVLRAREGDPLALWARSALAEFYYKLRDYDAALEVAQSLLEITPDDAEWLAYVGLLYAEKQESFKALSFAKTAAGLTGGNQNLELGVALIYATLGYQSEAREILQRIDLESETRYVSPGFLAAVYANLGENDLAMKSLAHGVEEYDSWIFNLDFRIWDPIRSDPRFIKLCKDLEMACTN